MLEQQTGKSRLERMSGFDKPKVQEVERKSAQVADTQLADRNWLQGLWAIQQAVMNQMQTGH